MINTPILVHKKPTNPYGVLVEDGYFDQVTKLTLPVATDALEEIKFISELRKKAIV